MESHPQQSTEEVQSPRPVAVVAVEQPEEREHESLVEAGTASKPGIIDITGLVGVPTVTVARLTL